MVLQDESTEQEQVGPEQQCCQLRPHRPEERQELPLQEAEGLSEPDAYAPREPPQAQARAPVQLPQAQAQLKESPPHKMRGFSNTVRIRVERAGGPRLPG
jgi:hypothetical protein